MNPEMLNGSSVAILLIISFFATNTTAYCNYNYNNYGRRDRVCTCIFAGVNPEFESDENVYRWYTDLNYPESCNMLHLKTILTTAEANFFPNRNGFTQVFLNNTYLKTIEPGALNNLQYLTELHLENNELVNITDGLFNSLNALKNLYLDHNQINYVSEYAFMGAQNLSLLSLAFNNIVALDDRVFKPIFQLERLSIGDNPLEAACNLDLTLTELNVRNLGIRNVSADMLNLRFIIDENRAISTSVSKIQVLEVSHNKISFLNGSIFKNARNLVLLNMSFNNIRELYANTFYNSGRLEAVDFHHNEISVVSQGAFHGLLSLQHVDLSQNKIKQLGYGHFESLHNLRILNLSTNMISDFNYVRSSKHEHLKLYLDNNRLKVLKTEVFLKVTELSLDNNLWKCSDLSNIVAFLQKAETYILDGTVHDSHNIHKIACDHTKFVSVSQEFVENSSVNTNKFMEKINEQFERSSFFKFYESDFENTAFYNFFKNFKAQSVNEKLLQIILNLTRGINDTENLALQEKLIGEYTGKNGESSQVAMYFVAFLLCGIMCILLIILYVTMKKNRFLYNVADSESRIELRE